MSKKLGRNATLEERAIAHRVKMDLKRNLRDAAYVEYQNSPQPHIFANISKHHEFYGDTPAEHEARKK